MVTPSGDAAHSTIAGDPPLGQAKSQEYLGRAGLGLAVSMRERGRMTDHSPLQRKKQPSGLGMFGRISRTVSRQSDTRAETRYAGAIPEGTALAVEGAPAGVINVSRSGMKICGELGEREIGENLSVEFDGFEPMTGRLVWMNGPEAGIALPAHSIGLFDRAQ